jgi:IclR family acetate operon transcriptional repressor
MLLEKNEPIAQRRRRPKDKKVNGEGDAVRAIARALDVLDCFTDQTPELNLKDIGEAVQLPESSLFRILLTLEGKGYLVQNPNGTYCLPPKLLLGKVYERAERLRVILRPYLQQLAGRFDETASLAYLYGDRIQALDTVESFHEFRMTNKPGRVLPPHCSSLGKAIAAFQEPAAINRILEAYGLYRRTENTVTERQALLTEFAEIRARGYSVDREESVLGGICIGAAIRTDGNRVVSALSVSTPRVRMTQEREQEITQTVLETARAAAQALRL